MDPEQHKRVDRRTFLKRGAIAGGRASPAPGSAISAAGGRRRGDQPPRGAAAAGRARPPTVRGPTRPNILVIVVDQLRFPQWFVAGADRRLGCRRTSQRLREGARLVRAPLHRLQRLHARRARRC